MSEDKKVDRVNMNWPLGLKDQVVALTGPRGVTKFVVEAVETRLTGEDRVKNLQKEVDELRYFTQLVLDRYVMGGDHENRESFLMELDLPAWLRSDGWPSELAKLIPRKDPVAEPVGESDESTERVPTQPPAPIGVPPLAVEQPEGEVTVTEIEGTTLPPYTVEDLHAPSYAVAREVQAGEPFAHAAGCMLDTDHGGTCKVPHAFVHSAEGSGKVCMADDCAEGPDAEVHQVETPVQNDGETPVQNGDSPSRPTGVSDDFLARVQRKAQEKGLDISGAGLKPASTIETPAKPQVHNHSWIRHDDGELHCDCGARIDTSDKEAHPNGIVREVGPLADAATEPAPELQRDPEPATPVAPEPESPATLAGQPNPFADPDATGADPFPAPATRSLDDFDVDF